MKAAGAIAWLQHDRPVLLAAFRNAWRRFELYPESMRVRKVPLWRSLVGRTAMDPQGWFGSLGGTPVALFVREGTLNLLVGDKLLRVDENTTARLTGQGGNRVLTVYIKSSRQVTLPYRRPTPWPPVEVDPTPMIEEEDYDYGLFLRNMIEDPERQRRILLRSR